MTTHQFSEPYFMEKDIWQRAFRLSIRVIRMTRTLPKESAAWELTKQVVRSSCSIPANIAEGSGGSSKKEFVRYMDVARKSALETFNWFLIIEESFDLQNRMIEIKSECLEIIKILSAIVIKSKS